LNLVRITIFYRMKKKKKSEELAGEERMSAGGERGDSGRESAGARD
jgi:hypothetical protein